MRHLIRNLSCAAQRLTRDTRGAIIVPLAFALPVLFGVAMVAIDAGRYFNLQTSIQGGVDSLALAAAAELDGKPNSITRADRAIDTLLVNDQRFGQGPATISRAQITVRYLSSLPPGDGQVISDIYATQNPLKAGFVEVRIPRLEFSSFF